MYTYFSRRSNGGFVKLIAVKLLIISVSVVHVYNTLAFRRSTIMFRIRIWSVGVRLLHDSVSTGRNISKQPAD